MFELADVLGVKEADLRAAAFAFAAVVGAISVAVASFEYRLKAKVERAETDTKLARLFADLVPVADGFRNPALPDGLLEALLKHEVLTKEDFEVSKDGTRDSKAGKMLQSLYVTAPSGAVTMVTALSAIAELGARHEVLRQPAYEAITGLAHHENHDLTSAAWVRAKTRIERGRKGKQPKKA